MLTMLGTGRSRRAVAALAMVLPMLAACAQNPTGLGGAGMSGQLAAPPGFGAGAGGLGGAGGPVTPGSAQDLTVNVGDRVFFETDSTELTAEARQTLDRQAQWLALYPSISVTLQGHADERGTREYNIALGARRASAAMAYLTARGVAPGRMQTISFGKERPVAVCDNISCWSQNRRAVTAINGG